jgi:hypothetical protein
MPGWQHAQSNTSRRSPVIPRQRSLQAGTGKAVSRPREQGAAVFFRPTTRRQLRQRAQNSSDMAGWPASPRMPLWPKYLGYHTKSPIPIIIMQKPGPPPQAMVGTACARSLSITLQRYSRSVPVGDILKYLPHPQKVLGIDFGHKAREPFFRLQNPGNASSSGWRLNRREDEGKPALMMLFPTKSITRRTVPHAFARDWIIFSCELPRARPPACQSC